MDPVSIATAAATAATALYTVSNILSTFVSDAKSVDDTLRTIRKDVDSLLGILKTIKSVLTAPSNQTAFEAEEVYGNLWEAIHASVKDCCDTAASIQDILATIKSGTSLQAFVAKSIRQVRFLKKKSDIDKMQLRVTSHKTNLQLSLQTMNILVAQSSSNHLTESIGPKVDDLWKMLRKTTLTEGIEDGTPGLNSEDPKDMELSRHTNELRASTMDVLSRTGTENILPEYDENPKPPAEMTPSLKKSDSDSDDELEVEISLSLLAKGVELCNQREYGEAEATLQNSLQAIQRMDLHVTSVEAIKEAQLKLAIVYLYQEKWNQAEEILLYLTVDSTTSDVENNCRLDALYYLSQIYLARHVFDLALDACKEARSGRRKLLTKHHPSYYQSVVLLILIYETSNDRTAAATYAKTIPADCLSDKGTIAVLRFSSDGMNLSIDGELAAVKTLSTTPYDSDFDNRYTDLGLRWAAAEGYKNVAQLLLWRGVKVDAPSIDMVTPLMCAAQAGHTDVVQLLLDKGADIHRVGTGSGGSALSKAASNGRDSTVRLLLARGAIIEGFAGSGWSTLMGAALHGHDGTIRLLLEKGADVNVMNKYKRNALMYAAREGHVSTVALLLQAGAYMHARDENGATALDMASEKTDIPRILKDAGATGRRVGKREPAN